MKYTQSEWRGWDANITMVVYGCKRVKGCSRLCQEPEAHTFKRTEMIICTWKFTTNSKIYNTTIHLPRPLLRESYPFSTIRQIRKESYRFCLNHLNYILLYWMTFPLTTCGRQLRRLGFLKNMYQNMWNVHLLSMTIACWLLLCLYLRS